MRDFRALVRTHLPPLALPRAHELKIIDELAAQLEDVYEALVAGGRSDDEAWSELQRQLPDWTALRDELLDAEPAILRFAQPDRRPFAGPAKRALLSSLGGFVNLDLLRDLRSGVRLLVKAPGFTVTTLLTLAVCLGAKHVCLPRGERRAWIR